jgi:acetyl esterase/lipase
MIDRRALLGLAAALALPATAARAEDEIAYGEGPDRRLDVHGRPGLSGAPVLVYVHGGGWRRGDKRMVHDLPEYARRHGLLLVSVNYRMAPQVDAGGCAEDVAAAGAWVRTNIARYGGDLYERGFVNSQMLAGARHPTDYTVDAQGTVRAVERLYRGAFPLR